MPEINSTIIHTRASGELIVHASRAAAKSMPLKLPEALAGSLFISGLGVGADVLAWITPGRNLAARRLKVWVCGLALVCAADDAPAGLKFIGAILFAVGACKGKYLGYERKQQISMSTSDKVKSLNTLALDIRGRQDQNSRRYNNYRWDQNLRLKANRVAHAREIIDKEWRPGMDKAAMLRQINREFLMTITNTVDSAVREDKKREARQILRTYQD